MRCYMARPARWATGGPRDHRAWRLDASKDTRSPHNPQGLAGQRLDRLIERVHALGPRPLAELLGEIAMATGEPGLIADRVAAYARLDPELVCALRADRFPPRIIEVLQ